MTKRGPAFGADDYVIRHGMRGFGAALLGLAAWTIPAVIVVAARPGFPSIPAAAGLAIGELALLAACGVELHRAARREVLFAVHSDGVYFGSGPAKEDVPWETIWAVDLFTEPRRGRGNRGSYRCVGVRLRGTAMSARGTSVGRAGAGRAGAGRASAGRASADRASAEVISAYLSTAGGTAAGEMRASRTKDGRSGGGETTRFAYRRMIGWRADRRRLTEAVHCYAPAVPVLDGTGLAPSPSRAQERHPGS